MSSIIGAIYHRGELVEFSDPDAMDAYAEYLDGIAEMRRERARRLRQERRDRSFFRQLHALLAQRRGLA